MCVGKKRGTTRIKTKTSEGEEEGYKRKVVSVEGKKKNREGIKKFGLEKSKKFLLVSIGTNKSLNKLHKRSLPNLTNSRSYTNPQTVGNYFKISKKNIDTINSKTPLEDLLTEKASILV